MENSKRLAKARYMVVIAEIEHINTSKNSIFSFETNKITSSINNKTENGFDNLFIKANISLISIEFWFFISFNKTEKDTDDHAITIDSTMF